METSFIDRLKEEPKHKRHMYAAGTSFVIVAVIFAVWISVKLPALRGETKVIAVEQKKQPTDTESIFGAFGNDVGQVLTGFKNAFSSVKEKFGAKTQYEANPNPFQTE